MCPETICLNQIFSQFSSQEQFGQLHWNFAHDAFWYQTELPAKHIIYFSIIVIFIIIFLESFFLVRLYQLSQGFSTYLKTY